MNNTPRPGQPEPPKPAPPPFDEPKPMRDPEPDRLPDEAPRPNPDESDAPPIHAASRDQTPDKETKNLAEPEPLPPKKARQGREGRPVLYVLIGALLLAMLVWWAVEIYGGAIAPDNPAGDPDTVPIEELQTEPAQ
jgi:hypothetical protein